jgi:uncharacterized membrane protein YdjX (TVP38/TMEM64 family)
MIAKRLRHEIEFLLFLIALAAIWYLGRNVHIDTQAIEQALVKFPLFISCIVYIALYVAVTFFVFFSKDLFWIIGAVIFKPLLATFLICVAEAINAAILFHLARRFGRAFVEKRVSQKYQHLDEKLGRVSFFWLCIFRAAPLIPYRFMDLAAGLTKINFRTYLKAVIAGSPIKMFWIEYVLYGVGKNILTNPNALVAFFLDNRLLLLLSLVYLVMVIMVVYKLSRRG